jgi:predicted phage terminase large subunit-like protein
MTLHKIFQHVCQQQQKKFRSGGLLPPLLEGSLLDWAAHFLPHHFHRPPSKMHRWLAERLDLFHSQRGTKLNVLAPRNSAKSTIAALAFPLRELLTGREPYIWLVSDTKSQAYTHLENIKNELTDNPLLAEAYPDAYGKGDSWRCGSIRLRNGTIIEAFGTGQRIRGRKRNEHRPTLIICDDLQNDQHSVSAEAREKSRNWFHGTLLKAGSDRTNVIHLATALHREAIALELLHTPGWCSRTFRAIEQFPKNMSLWTQWESIYTNVANVSHVTDADAFYESHRVEMNEDAVVLWEEQEPLYALMKMRVESGYASFEREKQNSPINPELCEFPESYFDEHIWYTTTPAPPQEGNKSNIVCSALALDPSKGKDSARGDYSAFVFVALSEDGTFYVDAHLERLPTSALVALGVELYRKYQPTIFCVEANQFQELLCDEFERQFANHPALSGTPPRVGNYIYPLKNTLNKTIRIRRLEPYLSSRRLRFCASSPSCRLLVEQLRSFPVGSHDDGPDALEMALRMVEFCHR